MTGTRWLGAVGLGVLLAGSGCVSCGHQVCKPVIEAGPNCEVPACDRRHVYTVLVNGLTPAGPSGLDGLREKLAGHGYAKVYLGGLCHGWWLWDEMNQVHKDDPAARFVVVGYDVGCGPAAGLARDAAAKGIPVDTLVLLDPSGKPDLGPGPVRTVMIRCTAGAVVPHAEGIPVPGATHLTLATHPTTVEIVCGLLKETAARVDHPPVVVEPEWLYDGAPPPRAVPVTGPGDTGDWSFLHDRPGAYSIPLTPVSPDKPGAAAPLPGTWVPAAPAPAQPLTPLGESQVGKSQVTSQPER